METLLFLAPAMTASVLLALMLGYFGNHILSRGIIFIDIAVAQIAALGTMIGLLIGFAEQSQGVQWISYAFTIGIMALFGLTKFRKSKLPQEALIGIIYCIALGLALLLADRIPGGSNYISKTISGNILWTTWTNVLSCFIIFVAIVVIQIWIRKPIQHITNSYEAGTIDPSAKRWHDVLFYVTFGIVIVKAVPIAGIFMVFILLIAPASLAILITKNWTQRLWLTGLFGFIGSIAGILLSYHLTISNGPAVVCLLGGSVLIATILVVLLKRSKKIANV